MRRAGGRKKVYFFWTNKATMEPVVLTNRETDLVPHATNTHEEKCHVSEAGSD